MGTEFSAAQAGVVAVATVVVVDDDDDVVVMVILLVADAVDECVVEYVVKFSGGPAICIH